MKNSSEKMHLAEKFARMFVSLYFEARAFDEIKKYFAEYISWYGTGAHEICRNKDDACRLLDEERAAWDGRFKVTHQSYNVRDIDVSTCLISGEIKVIEDGLNVFLLEMECRLSLLLMRGGNGYKIVHLHCSVPNAAQAEGEFIHKTIVADYNRLLEEKLAERTKLLKQKTAELETLANNICGGVQVCAADEEFTVKYIGAGFAQLTGYTLESLQLMHNASHMAIVYPPDATRMKAEICQHLKSNTPFSVEYRIMHKDGHNIWVLDKGVFFDDASGQKHVQCMLTDISAQKEQENLLRISEKRYETAMLMSDMVMFEYNIVTRQLILYERDSKLYNVGNVIENGVETFISKGIIEQDSIEAYREMYRKIHAGAEIASCFVHAKDAIGNIHEYELTLHTVFDFDGVPQRAVGVRKNVSNALMLQREQQFGKALVLDKKFVYEANVTSDTVIWMDEYYLDALDVSLNKSYSGIMNIVCDRFVAPEYREIVLKKTSADFLEKEYSGGNRLVVFSYKRKNSAGEYIWYEATISLIRDERSADLFMRFYNIDIDERKQREHRANEERRIYETMTARAALAYEVNISNNIAIRGHECWAELYGIEINNIYSEMITAFSQRAIYAEDGPGFAISFNREHVINEYENGIRQINYQYRKPNSEGELRWVCCTLHMYEDPETGDIKGYSYVEDIHEQKRQELELKFNAEHDAMTKLYNKATCESLIEQLLLREKLSGKSHALLMVDIDNFKSVNDSLGHLFGDKVLCEIADKLKGVFREGDIIGRIGGDEFIVLMENAGTQEAVLNKANEVCRCLSLYYSSDNKNVSISASVGVAIYPHHGLTYTQLYAHADKALYKAKTDGKNKYSMM